jgi:hypothetical protein
MMLHHEDAAGRRSAAAVLGRSGRTGNLLFNRRSGGRGHQSQTDLQICSNVPGNRSRLHRMSYTYMAWMEYELRCDARAELSDAERG